MAVCGQKPVIQVFFFNFFKICRYGYQKIRLAKPKLKQKTVCENVQKHAI